MTTDQAMQLALQHSRAGRTDAALALLLQVVQINPEHAEAHRSLGTIFLSKGQLDDAIAAYRKAIQLNPESAEAHNDIAFAFNRKGNLDEAVTACLRTAELRPDSPQAHNNLGNALRDSQRLDEAIVAYNRAVELKPDYAEAYSNMAVALTDSRRLDEGMAACLRAIALNPAYPEAYLNLGNVFNEMARFDEAITAYARALQLKPNYAQAYNSMGNALRRKGLLDEAIDAYNRAIQLKPDHAAAHSNLGIALRDKGQFDGAMLAYSKAIELDPSNIKAHFNLAILLLLLGNFARGWTEYEWRVKRKDEAPSRTFLRPRWDGGQLEGKRILLHNEQGFGDTLQFVRYVPLVASRGGRVILTCQSSLINILSEVPNVEKVVTATDPMPDFDVHCPLLSLPKAFATDLKSVPASIPYLTADPALIEVWATRLEAKRGRLKIGIAWTGSPTHVNDHNRSISLSQFSALANAENVICFSLQKGEAAEQISRLGTSVIDLTSEIKDFADTAALIVNLDLIISVDTAVAHLAGALGKSVWVLLPFIPDWRWLLDREDSPWYPTMRLFRQRRAGDWEEPIQRIVKELTEMTSLLGNA